MIQKTVDVNVNNQTVEENITRNEEPELNNINIENRNKIDENDKEIQKLYAIPNLFKEKIFSTLPGLFDFS